MCASGLATRLECRLYFKRSHQLGNNLLPCRIDDHRRTDASPLFKTLNIIKLHDLVSYRIAIFKYWYKNRLLPCYRRRTVVFFCL